MKKSSASPNPGFRLMRVLFISILIFLSKASYSQGMLVIDASSLDGMDITRDNLFSYQILSNLSGNVNVKIEGNIRFKQSDYNIRYSFETKLNPGRNLLDLNTIHPSYTYSSTGLRELFVQYNTLPSGTYEYCISVTPYNNTGEIDLGSQVQECIYHNKEEMFLINLLEPENNAKLYEKNPMLAWVANYSFSSELTYKLRITKIMRGQNTQNAILRNKPIYQESGLTQNTLVYPATAKPLETYQPYAWTIDAYYKNILLGCAEPWRFIILEDSINEAIPKFSEFIDIRKEIGSSKTYAVGELKIKYNLEELKNDVLTIDILFNNEPVKTKPLEHLIIYGDNRITIPLQEEYGLKHLKNYMLIIKTKSGQSYSMPFRYVNPEFAN